VEASSAAPLALRPTFPIDDVCDQAHVFANEGKQLIYHSASFDHDIELSGFFRLVAWIAIDQPDTDIRVSVYEIDLDGDSVLLTSDCVRARFRESLREEKLVSTKEPLRYCFKQFTFVSRLLRKGSRLRLVIGPINSIYFEKNYNRGGVVAEETISDALPVTVKLFHDSEHPSALYVPLAHPDEGEP